MARIRTIKPEFWRSPSTALASPRARLLYIAMWNWADDHGVGEWTPRELMGFAFPNDLDLTNAEFQSLCTEVATCFGTTFYLVSGRRYYAIPAWDTHQKNERRAEGRYPKPDHSEASPDQAFILTPDKRGSSAAERGRSGSGTGEQGNRGTGEIDTLAQPPVGHLFDDVWGSWPKKDDKKDAQRRWPLAVKESGFSERELADIAIVHGNAYRAHKSKQFTPAFVVWLNKARWNNAIPSGDATQIDAWTQHLIGLGEGVKGLGQ